MSPMTRIGNFSFRLLYMHGVREYHKMTDFAEHLVPINSITFFAPLCYILDMSSILITGGDGFIGSHLADTLIAEGHTVKIIDTLVAHGGKNLNPKAEHFKLSIADGNIRP